MSDTAFVTVEKNPHVQKRSAVRTSAWVTAGMMMVIYAMNFLDRQLVATLAKPITQALNLSDAQFGLLTGIVFVALFAVFGIPAGWLVDRVRHRVRLVSIIYGIWSIATILTGLAQNFVHRAFARALCGIGEGGGTPTCVPVVADSFPRHKRGTALGIYNLGVPLGLGLGVSIAASIAAVTSWRHAFWVLGAFGIVMAIALPFIVREPKRGEYDEPEELAEHTTQKTEHEQSAHYTDILKRVLYKDRVLAMSLLASALACVVFYGFAAFLVLYLMRGKGMNFTEIATWLGPSLAIALAISQFSSGYLSDHFAAKKRFDIGYGLLPLLGTVITAGGIVGTVLAPIWQWSLAFGVVAEAAALFWMPALEAFIQNRVRHNERGTTIAVYVMIDNLVGQAVGPSLVGGMSTYFMATHSANHLPFAMAVVLIPLSIVVIVGFAILYKWLRPLNARGSLEVSTVNIVSSR